jgi:hypothetical protein
MSIARYISKLGALLNSNGQVLAGGLASGAARANFGAGAVLQVQQSTFNGTTNTSSATLVDSGLSVTITPSSVTSKILVKFSIPVSGGSNNSVSGRVVLLRDATTIFDIPSMFIVSVQYPTVVGMVVAEEILDVPATTSPITYKVQVSRNGYAGTYAGNLAFGNQGGTSVAACQITAMEIAA